MEISNYDAENYDYQTYWKDRRYEDRAEFLLLSRLLKNKKGKRFLDVGGSFGRNLPLYAKNFDEVVILDYSLNTLLKYEKEILEKYPNAKLVAANAYKMPFANNSFDGGMSIRVLHHISRPEDYFSQVGRVINHRGTFIQEIANKVHLKATLKWIATGQFDMFDEKPYKQPTRSSKEKEGSHSEGVFLNFHPDQISHLMKKAGFSSVSHTSCSFFRIPLLKKTLPPSVHLGLETFAQIFLGWSNIAPSVVLTGKMIKVGEEIQNNKNLQSQFLDILKCPMCMKKLSTENGEAYCKNCDKKYQKHSTIWDLRVD